MCFGFHIIRQCIPAAHGMHSTPGQGARTAFEDAHQLNLLLDEVFNAPKEDITMEKALKRCLSNPLDYLLRMNLSIAQLL